MCFIGYTCTLYKFCHTPSYPVCKIATILLQTEAFIQIFIVCGIKVDFIVLKTYRTCTTSTDLFVRRQQAAQLLIHCIK